MGAIEALRARIALLAGRRVLVVGDPVLDVYLHGTTLRISREAPVPIVRQDSIERRLGGAANTAANLSALGARAELFGIVGEDEQAGELADLARSRGIDAGGFVRSASSCTVTKTRVLAGSFHTTRQQLLRIDREPNDAPDEAAREILLERVVRALPGADALIISDYGDGSLTETYVALARKAAGKVVVVDSRYALSAYSEVTAVTPNEPEVEASLGITLRTEQDVLQAADRITKDLRLSCALITRGREGMVLAAEDGSPVSIGAHGAPDAVDVTGAGDTVTAVFALALASGSSALEAAVLANCAASVVVQTIGTATSSPSELHETLASIAPETLAKLEIG